MTVQTYAAVPVRGLGGAGSIDPESRRFPSLGAASAYAADMADAGFDDWTVYRIFPSGSWVKIGRFPGGAEPLWPYPIAVVDTETTGLSPTKGAEIHQIGAVLLDERGREVSTFDGRARPRRLDAPGVARALAVSRTRIEDLLPHPPPETLARSFAAWRFDHGMPVSTAFNDAFERKFLEDVGLRLTWVECLRKRARRHFGRSIKLEAAARELEVLVEAQTHQAIDDARLAGRLLVKLSELDRDRGLPIHKRPNGAT